MPVNVQHTHSHIARQPIWQPETSPLASHESTLRSTSPLPANKSPHSTNRTDKQSRYMKHSAAITRLTPLNHSPLSTTPFPPPICNVLYNSSHNFDQKSKKERFVRFFPA
ncbi:hypothetical protein N7G274_005791 [Stereocaulon virgatum]|uniref:Uncharacterized protein n=1 Tax=Stereocaulon virgatum TaxID=373712 RepID=A0ABR4A7C5_9LECA